MNKTTKQDTTKRARVNIVTQTTQTSYKPGTPTRTRLHINKCKEGEPLEQKLERMIANKEKMQGDTPIIFTERAKGVEPQYNIRTDRMEVAVDATTKVKKSYQARREEAAKARQGETKPKQEQNDAGAENKSEGKP